MYTLRGFLLAAAVVPAILAQPPTAPVIHPRGVINAFTQQPAPSLVARGGLLHINGLNLGPPSGLTATTLPLPTKLGDVEVLINGTPVPVLSAIPERIIAQVPYDAALGAADVVVRRGGVDSRPARCIINALEPSVRTASGTGFGVAGSMSGRMLSLAASGLGITDPRVDSGAAAADGTVKPAAAISAYVGGLRANTTATLSDKRVGEFDIQIEVPAQARPGDLISLLATGPGGGMRSANRTVFQNMRAPDVQFLPMPEGIGDLRSIEDTDLNGTYIAGTLARTAEGCYEAYLFDLNRKKASKLADCLTTANRNAPSPFVTPVDQALLAALVGPPPADAQPGAAISSKVQVFNPAQENPLNVELPAAASQLTPLAANLAAVIPGTPARIIPIDGETGELGEPVNLQAVGGGQGAGGMLGGLNIDVDGLKSILSQPIALNQGRIAVIVGDDANNPKRAKYVVLNAQRQPVASRDYPDGWLPLLAAEPPRNPGGGGQGAMIQIPRLPIFRDPERPVLYALARAGDNSKDGMIAFNLDASEAKLIEFPSNTFVASCAQQINPINLDLSGRRLLFGGNTPETGLRNPCTALGFIVLDLATQTASFARIQGDGQFNAAVSGEINDFAYGANTAPPQNRADALFVFDGVTSSTSRFDLPPGVASFQNLIPVPQLNSLIAVATNRVAGDAGFIVFDLDRAERRVLNVPEGFVSVSLATVNPPSVFPATRKLVARGIRSGNTGAQLLIYDLITTDLTIVQNPEGAAWFGPVPAQAPQPGQQGAPSMLLISNPKANTVTGVVHNADRKQIGVMTVRVQ